MKWILGFLMIAVLLVPAAMAGGLPEFDLSDCFVVEGPYVVGVDTFWYTNEQANAADDTLMFDGGSAETADQFAPINVPVGTDSQGELIMVKKRVRAVMLYSRDKFVHKTFYPNGQNSGTIYVPCDSTGILPSSYDGGTNIASDKFPCWAIIFYPDSVYVKEALADTVRSKLIY